MEMTDCGHGHFYNPQTHSSCPYCGVQIDLPGKTRPFDSSRAFDHGGATPDKGGTRVAGSATGRSTGGRSGDETIAFWPERLGGIDPVVGWLVCVEGPDRGRDYRIHTERNFIGRDPTMDIAITGDPSISRKNHAVISYNPKRQSFRLAPGDSHGLVDLNDEEVVGAVELKPYDRIALGATRLLFIPFCGPGYQWPVEAP